jgi:hypothetical protein
MSIDYMMSELEFRQFRIYDLERKLAKAKKRNKLIKIKFRCRFIQSLKRIKFMNKKVQKALDFEIYKLENFRSCGVVNFNRKIKFDLMNELLEKEEYPLLKKLP